MEHFILHFLTGTMAFRIPRTSRRRSDAEIPDVFFQKAGTRATRKENKKNRNAGKAAKGAEYARNMQDGFRS